jgi:antitoxin (DNA-binding transcriptional repressor) of toxin-antitoxin stability system
MKTLELTNATAPLAEYARNVDRIPVILTQDGKPIAALISLENADAETIRLSGDDQFIALIENSRARRKTVGGISNAEMRRRLNTDRVSRETT